MLVLALTSRRSEVHTSELQSLMRISYAVFCFKKKISLFLFIFFFVVLILRPPISTPTNSIFPYTTLFPSDAARQIIFVSRLDTDLAVGRKFVPRPPRREQYGAAGYVSTLQRALRPAQDFNSFKVERVHVGAGIDAQIDAVDEHADRRLRVGIARGGAQSTNIGRGVTSRATICAQRNAGRANRNIGQVLKRSEE